MQDSVDSRDGDDGYFDPDAATPDGFDPDDLAPRPFTLPERRRALTVAAILLVVILLAVLPPLINVNRYRRQIASSISLSLGRPVHIDSVSLDILPMPGFTLQNFVVAEDPAFGSEPVIRANSVRARLRWSSLWRRRVEFSRISLTDPSVNLVHREDGRWNVESILLQASRMPAAPTGQRGVGSRPRFPYIEATGARVNVKMGLEKMPLSLTDADFALWLPQAEQWQVRLNGHPTRTNTAAIDTGALRIGGTLGRATRMDDVPVDLQADWTGSPLGAASLVLLGRDAGLRGDLTVHASVTGTVGANDLQTQLQVAQLRRADFVPPRPLAIDLSCKAHAEGDFHRLSAIQCTWPAGTTDAGLILTGAVPESLHPDTAQLAATVKDVPAAGLLDVLRVASPRIAPTLHLDGIIAARAESSPARTMSFDIPKATLALGTGTPYLDAPVHAQLDPTGQRLAFTPLPIDLGGPTPATLDGQLSSTGYGVHLTGPVTYERLMELARALPQFGDGLFTAVPASTTKVDLIGTRAWRGVMVWTAAAPVTKAPAPRRKRR